MSTELNTYSPTRSQVMTIQDKMKYAEALASASLLPKAYQRNPGNVLLATELGESLAIPTIQAINQVHVIEGKPSASAALISMLVRRAGHRLRIKGDDQSATAEIVRSDDPDFTYSVTWTMERARNAGVTGKDNWRKYPAAMLKARAITEVARDACQEALMGVQYTPEELGASTDEDGNVVEVKEVRKTVQRRKPAQQAPAPELPDLSNTPDPETDTEAAADDDNADEATGEIMSTRSQWTRLARALDGIGIQDRGGKLAAIQSWATEQVITRPIENSASLTETEAEQLITELEAEATTEGDGDGGQWEATAVPE